MVTEKIIQDRLFELMFSMTEKDKKSNKEQQKFFYITPNVNLYGWESDLVTKDRKERIFEFEIKTSRSDFFNDLKKKKHKILSRESDEKKPNFFYYILPEAEVSLNEIPDYAGLYTYRSYLCNSRGLIIEFFLEKKAPKLSERKADDSDIVKLLTSVYFKFWRNRTKKSTRIKKNKKVAV